MSPGNRPDKETTINYNVMAYFKVNLILPWRQHAVRMASVLVIAMASGTVATATPLAQTPSLSSFLCILTTVTGGDPPINFMVKLNGPAPPRGANVHVISRNSQVASVGTVQVQKSTPRTSAMSASQASIRCCARAAPRTDA